MTLTAYTPFDSQIDRLFTDAFRSVGKYVPNWVPTCNAWEDSDKFVLELVLPGWQSEEVKLALENGVLTVEGMREKSELSREEKKRIFHIREVESGSFSRSFRLPTNIEWDKANAAFKDGILNIEFPKREDAKPRRILIR